jgi:hypothetical protein
VQLSHKAVSSNIAPLAIGLASEAALHGWQCPAALRQLPN